MSVTNETVIDGTAEESNRRKSRRRSSLSARRFSLVNPFVEPPTEQSQVEESRLTQGSAIEGLIEGRGQVDEGEDEEEDYWGYGKEIDSLSQESVVWEKCLQRSEDRQTASYKRLSNNLQPLRITDLPLKVQRQAKLLIGTQPDYSSLLKQTQNKAIKAFLQMDELANLAQLSQECEQMVDKLLTKFSERLGEYSFGDFNTPRTLIRQRLAVATPKN